MRTGTSLRVGLSYAPKSKIKCRRKPKTSRKSLGLFLFFRMGWGVPYLLPWALNDTGKALLGRGVQKKMPWAEEYLFYGLSWISPGSKRTPRHTSPRGMGLTWSTTGPARVGGHGSTLWVFLNKSALRADLRVFQRVGCRALGCVVPSRASKQGPSWPLGSIAPSGGQRGPPDTPPQGAWA